MKTGNTDARTVAPVRGEAASMEPGHEDREYPVAAAGPAHEAAASMEPGHEDREYQSDASSGYGSPCGLNGARS